MKQKSTILVVAPYYPPHNGGLERYAHEVVRRMQSSSAAQVVVLTTSESGADTYEERDGVSIHRLGYRLKLSNSPVAFSWIPKVRRILGEVAPDIVHIHTPVPGLGDLVALMLPRETKLLVTYHAGSMRKGSLLIDLAIGLYEHFFMHLLLRRADHIACSSDFVRTQFLTRYVHKASTITPAVDSTIFAPETHVPSDAKVILAVGGLGRGEAHKGLSTLLECMPTLVGQIPGVQLRVAGDGDMRAVYEMKAKELGLEHVVQFLGRLDTERMAAAYREANVFVHPTKNDSFPTVILEAMASGVPVVSTTVGSISDMVEEGKTGYLVAPNDSTSLQARLIEILSNVPHAQKLGAAGREKVIARFSWEQTAELYRSRYEALLRTSLSIAHVVAYYPPHPGGMEVVAEHLAQGAAEQGAEVQVFTSTIGAHGAPRTIRRPHLLVRRLLSLEFAHTPLMWTLPLHLLFLPKNTLIHLHVAQAYVPEVTLLVAKLRGFRVVAHFHLDVEPSGPLGSLFVLYKRFVLPFVLQHVDAVLVASAEQAAVVVEKHGVAAARIHQVVNAVDDQFFQARMPYTTHAPFRILTLSRLTVQKRVDRLIEAMPLLDFDAELVVVGDGEDRAKLERLAEASAPGRVRFVGHIDHTHVPEQHAWADVFVIPSDREGGMPLNVLEAMAAGLPIVGSDASGVRELVGRVGVVVKEPSAETFAAALNALHGDKERIGMLSEKSAAAAKEYTWPHALGVVQGVYETVHTGLTYVTHTV